MYIVLAIDALSPARANSACHSFYSNELSQIEAEYESYNFRRDILDPNILQKAYQGQQFSEAWGIFKKLSPYFIAEIFSIYRNEHIVFLGRDAEYFYDLARMFNNGAASTSRIHLVNINDHTKNKNEIQPYLESLGLSEIEISKRGVVFVDTGYRGSILYSLRKTFSPPARAKMFGHMLHGKKQIYSGKRIVATSWLSLSFLENITPEASVVLEDLSGASKIEGLPHQTGRVQKYQKVGNTWHALSAFEKNRTESNMASDLRQDLKYTFQNRESLESYRMVIEEMIRLQFQPEYIPKDAKLAEDKQLYLKTLEEIKRIKKSGDANP